MLEVLKKETNSVKLSYCVLWSLDGGGIWFLLCRLDLVEVGLEVALFFGIFRFSS